METTRSISRVINTTVNQQNQANSALRRSSKSVDNLLNNIVPENSNQNTSVQASERNPVDIEAYIALQNKNYTFFYKDKKIDFLDYYYYTNIFSSKTKKNKFN